MRVQLLKQSKQKRKAHANERLHLLSSAIVLMAIRQLLQEPDPDDALVASIGELYRSDREKFNKLAAEHTKKHANE